MGRERDREEREIDRGGRERKKDRGGGKEGGREIEREREKEIKREREKEKERGREREKRGHGRRYGTDGREMKMESLAIKNQQVGPVQTSCPHLLPKIAPQWDYAFPRQFFWDPG
jgi:hypothetical protein